MDRHNTNTSCAEGADLDAKYLESTMLSNGVKNGEVVG
jgi:hypothetical protein